jgi:hypothetical protein
MTRLPTSPLALAMLVAGTALGGLACTGTVQDAPVPGGPGPTTGTGPNGRPMPTIPGNTPPSTPATADDSAGPLPLRRLTIAEFNNTVRDLVGQDAPAIDPSSGVSSDVYAFEHGFLKGATVGSANDARLFSKLSDDIATAAMGRLATLLPQGCATPAPAAEEGCAKKFIEEFGLRAFRRPPTTEEKGDLLGLYTRVRGAEVGLTYPEAMRTLISGMLQSPMFTYRWELAPAPTGSLARLDDYAMASRLSYTILATMPDAELFAAAAGGQLTNPDKIAEQAKRLLASERAKIGLGEFVVQWLNATSLPTLSKDEAFTNYTPAVGQAMLRESATFFGTLMQSNSSKLEELFTSRTSFVDGPLAKLYGVPGVTGNQMKQVELNPAQRGGILTHGSFLAAHADGDEPHPIRRGLEVLDRVLCTPIIPPVDFVPPPVKDVAPGIPNRKRFEESTLTEASCSACHGRINNAGFAFENFDAVGAWRDTDANQPVDASGAFPFADGEVKFKNAMEFSKAIATSKEARECFTKQFLEYSLRRPVHPSEQGSIKAMADAFAASGYDLKELLFATTKTRAFTHRLPQAGEGQQ